MAISCANRRTVLGVILLQLLLFSSLSAAQDSPAKARITFTLGVTARDTMTMTRSEDGLDLGIRQEKSTFLFSSVNGTEGGAGSDRNLASKYPLAWRLQARLVSTSVDVVSFDLDWQRTESRDGSTRPVAGDRRTITLHQGERHVLDFVRCPTDSPRANLIIEVSASPLEDEANAQVGLGYDLWLVHQAADGKKTTRRVAVAGRQGEKAPFRFEPVPLPLEPAAVDSPFRLEVDGTITARQAQDGTIQVALQASRILRHPTGGGGGGTGLKMLSLKPGETVEVELPVGNGFSSWRASVADLPRNPRAGVTVVDGSVRIDDKQFLAGATTSIILTVRRDR